MKRRAAVIFMTLVMMLMSATLCFAAEGELKIKEQYPADGATGTAIDNAGIKIWFDQDVYTTEESKVKANEKAVKKQNFVLLS